jgi:hypothetical protein
MDIVNFPGIIAEHGLLSTAQIDLNKDLLLIGKKMGKQRNGTQYENMAISIQELANLIAIAGGNETLAQTLVLGNTTGGTNIIFSATDSAIFNSGAFSGNLTRLALTGNHVWSLPNQSGTIALLSDIPAPTPTPSLSSVLGVGNSTGGNNINVSAGDIVSFANGIFAGSLSTTVLTGNQSWDLPDQSGTIALLSDIPSTPGLPAILNVDNTTSGYILTISDGDTIDYVSGLFTGSLNVTPLTGNQFWNLPDASGTIALLTDIPAVPTTLYSGNSTIGTNRNATLTDTLTFTRADAGYFQLGGNGYVINTGLNGAYFEWDHNGGNFNTVSTTHTRVGFKTDRSGTFIEMMSGGGKAYFNTNSYIEFYVNNTGTYCGMLDSSGNWRFGGNNSGGKVNITGNGSTSATSSQIWFNSGGSEYARMLDSGGLAIGINTLTGGFANAEKLRIDSVISADYTSTVVFDQNYSNTINNSNSATNLTVRIDKNGTFNTGDVRAIFSQARNDGSGSINYLYGSESMTYLIGNSTITNAFAVSARAQMQLGTITNYGGVDVSFQELGGGTITNMIGVLVRTPTNVTGGTITNTYGVLVQDNTLGTNDYGFVSAGQASNGFGTTTPSVNAILDLQSTTKAFKLPRMTVAQAGALTAEDSMQIYVTDTDGTFPTIGAYSRENGTWVKL